MKTVRSLRKFCKNQEFSGKSVCRIKFLPSPKKIRFQQQQKIARSSLFLSTKNPKN